MRNKFFIGALSLSLFTNFTLAGTMGPLTKPASWNWVGTISAGPVWENEGNSQTFYLAPNILKTYTANQLTNTLFDGELFLGMQKILTQTLDLQLGLAVAGTSNAPLSGMIWDDASPQFNNHTYHYTIQHTQVAVKGKLLANAGYWLVPWISGSIGAGFNRASDFTNTPTIFEALPNPNFASHTHTSFAYTLGAGVQKALDYHWQLGVGYEFTDWGKSNLSPAAGQTRNDGLILGHFYTNGLMFSLTYLA